MGPSLPEVLTLDAERLHRLQNRFQSLVVIAASSLLVSQFRSQLAAQSVTATAAAAAAAVASRTGPESSSSSSDTVAPAVAPSLPPLDLQATKRRLQILLADPSLQLQHLVSELASTAGLGAMGLPVEDVLRAEEQMRQSLLRVIDPSGPAFRSLSNALAASLLLYLLLGKEGSVDVASSVAPNAVNPSMMGVQTMVARLLGRVGGGIISGDVEELAGQVLALAGVIEAVHLDAIINPLFNHTDV